MRPTLSVVLPMYRTREAVPELLDRLDAALAPLGPVELVFVDDACPQGSGEAVLAHPPVAATVVLVEHDRNHGQHAAVLSGLRVASGEWCAVMDADLQDAPEDLPTLLDALRTGDARWGAVAAGRQGRYEKTGRLRTARLFRRAMWALSAGRVPPDAALFLVMTDETRRRVLALGDPAVHLVAAIGRTGTRLRSVPVDRQARPAGDSAYSPWRRAAAGGRALVVLTPAYPLVRRLRRRRPAPRLTVQRPAPTGREGRR